MLFIQSSLFLSSTFHCVLFCFASWRLLSHITLFLFNKFLEAFKSLSLQHTRNKGAHRHQERADWHGSWELKSGPLRTASTLSPEPLSSPRVPCLRVKLPSRHLFTSAHLYKLFSCGSCEHRRLVANMIPFGFLSGRVDCVSCYIRSYGCFWCQSFIYGEHPRFWQTACVCFCLMLFHLSIILG